MTRNDDFQLLTALDDERCELRCQGVFLGVDTHWHMTLLSLKACYEEHLRRHALPAGHPMCLRQFIHVSAPPAEGLQPVTVGLDVARLDYPTLLKATIMIRNYKALRLGRHEYGEPVNFPREL